MSAPHTTDMDGVSPYYSQKDMGANWEKINTFRTQKERLAGMIAEASAICQGLDLEEFRKRLDDLRQQMLNKPLRILVMGSYCCGKSSFVNALLGDEIMPCHWFPSMPVYKEVKYGETRDVALHFPTLLPDDLPVDAYPEKVRAHIKQYGLKNVPPLHVDHTDLSELMYFSPNDDTLPVTYLQNLYDKWEVYGPFDRLKDGVEIIEAAGINDLTLHLQQPFDYLGMADAIIFVIDACRPCSRDEMDFIESLRDMGFTDLFFVINRCDVIREKEKKKLQRYIEARLGQFTPHEIFFISSLQAIDGIKDGDKSLYDQSGVGHFAAEIEKYLAKQRGRASLLACVRELNGLMKDTVLYKVIPARRTLLDDMHREAKMRRETARPQMEALKVKTELLMSRLALRKEQTVNELRRAVERHFATLATSLPGWVDGYTPKTTLGIVVTQESVQQVSLEIADFVEKKIHEKTAEWEKKEWRSLLETRTHQFIDAAVSDMKEADAELISKIGEPFFPIVIRQRHCEDYYVLPPDVGVQPYIPIFVLWKMLTSIWVGNPNVKMQKLKNEISQKLGGKLNALAEEITKNLTDYVDEGMSNYTQLISETMKQEIARREAEIARLEDESSLQPTDSTKGTLDAYETQGWALIRKLNDLAFELIEQK